MECISIAALKRGEQCNSIDVTRNKRIKSECCGLGVFHCMRALIEMSRVIRQPGTKRGLGFLEMIIKR